MVCKITFVFILSLWWFHSPPCPNWNLSVSWKYCFPHNPVDWIWRWVTRCLSCSLVQLATILPLPQKHLALVPTSSDYNHTILYPAVSHLRTPGTLLLIPWRFNYWLTVTLSKSLQKTHLSNSLTSEFHGQWSCPQHYLSSSLPQSWPRRCHDQ